MKYSRFMVPTCTGHNSNHKYHTVKNVNETEKKSIQRKYIHAIDKSIIHDIL